MGWGLTGNGEDAASVTTIGSTWSGMVTQDPLHAKSDYFPGASLDAKWEDWDVAGTLTESVGDGALKLVQTSSAGNDVSGKIQAAPADNQFAVTAKISTGVETANNAHIGLIVGEDLSAGTGNPSTASFFSILLSGSSAGPKLYTITYENYQFGAGSITDQTDTGLQTACYLRLWVDRTAQTATAYFSSDGRAWSRLGTAQSWAAGTVTSIDSIGVCVDNVASGSDAVAYIEKVRIDITADPLLPVGGLVGLVAS